MVGQTLVCYPARWSFSFIVGPLYWSSIFPTKKYSADMYYCNADYYKTSVSWGLMLECFCLKSCFFAWLVWYLTWLTTPYWKWSGVRFMRAPTKPCRVGKIDRQELEAGTSPSCGSPGLRLFWSFDWWWALEGDERSLVCCGDFLNSPRKFWTSIRTSARRPYQDVSHPQSSLTG